MKKSLILAIAFVMLSAFNLYAFSIVNMVNNQYSYPSSWTAADAVSDTGYWIADHGQELMSVNITPASSDNKLRIDVLAQVGLANEQKSERGIAIGLFDENSEALAVMHQTITFNGDSVATAAIPLTYYMTAGTTDQKTFTVRVGVDMHNGEGGTVYFNNAVLGNYDCRVTSNITVTEIQP